MTSQRLNEAFLIWMGLANFAVARLDVGTSVPSSLITAHAIQFLFGWGALQTYL